MSASWSEHIGHGLQLLLGTTLLVAAATKLTAPTAFVAAVRDYQLVPSRLVQPLAYGVGIVEALVGTALVAGLFLGGAVPAAGALFVAFAVAIATNLWRGRRVRCGCFGSTDETISALTLVRIGALIVATATLAVLQLRPDQAPLKPAELVADGLDGFEHLVVSATYGAFLAVTATWLLHLRELRDLFRRLPREEAAGHGR